MAWREAVGWREKADASVARWEAVTTAECLEAAQTAAAAVRTAREVATAAAAARTATGCVAAVRVDETVGEQEAVSWEEEPAEVATALAAAATEAERERGRWRLHQPPRRQICCNHCQDGFGDIKDTGKHRFQPSDEHQIQRTTRRIGVRHPPSSARRVQGSPTARPTCT